MRSPASGVGPQSVHWGRWRVRARRLLRSSWRSRSARSRGMASGFAGPSVAPSGKTCRDHWSKSRSTLGSARTDAKAPEGALEGAGYGVTDGGHPGGDGIVPLRGVQLRGHAVGVRHVAGLPGLRWLGVRTGLTVRGDALRPADTGA